MSLTSYRAAPPRVETHRPSEYVRGPIDEEEVFPFLAGLATTYSPMS
jgi:hypothetical protein